MEAGTPGNHGTAWKKEDTARQVELAISRGFLAIDTTKPKHYQELLVGRALLDLAAKGTPKDRLFLQTKFTPLGGHRSLGGSHARRQACPIRFARQHLDSLGSGKW